MQRFEDSFLKLFYAIPMMDIKVVANITQNEYDFRKTLLNNRLESIKNTLAGYPDDTLASADYDARDFMLRVYKNHPREFYLQVLELQMVRYYLDYIYLAMCEPIIYHDVDYD